MRRPEFLARQARHPRGLLGALLAWVMTLETSAENERALQLLDLKPGDDVLEIGFGHGRTIARAAAMASQGLVAGVDVSQRMLQMAARYNRALIRQGRVELKLGGMDPLPYPDRRFTKVFSVHTIYFWAHPTAALREIRRVMKAGARLVLGFRPKEERALADFPSTIYNFYAPENVQSLLRETGYEQVRIEEARFSSRKVLFAVAHRTV